MFILIFIFFQILQKLYTFMAIQLEIQQISLVIQQCSRGALSSVFIFEFVPSQIELLLILLPDLHTTTTNK